MNKNPPEVLKLVEVLLSGQTRGRKGDTVLKPTTNGRPHVTNTFVGLQIIEKSYFTKKSHLEKGESVETNPVSMSRLESRSERVGADEVP